MPLKNFPDAPYYDDFDQSKNYMRILFRPGYSVQARELTQLQTSLQAQIDRFGRHVFKDGSQVLGGQPTFDNRFAYVKLAASFSHSGNTYVPETTSSGATASGYIAEMVEGRTLTGLTSGVEATVVQYTSSTESDPLTLFVKYTSTGTDNETQAFTPGEVIEVAASGVYPIRYLKVAPVTTGDATPPVGFGSRVSVNEGVYFVSGNFVFNAAQSLILDKYGTKPSARVVFKITEDIYTSAEDSSLFDNALGSPNEAAPGAHRYHIALDLIKQDVSLANRDENDIIQLLVITDGVVASVARTVYSELGDTLAQRTYEESGNYTVNPFLLNVREYLNANNNGGLYTDTQIAEQEDITTGQAQTFGEARLAVGVEPSVAYVYGYRIETIDTKYIPVEKARDTGYFAEKAIYASLGNYVQINTLVSFPDITGSSTLNLRDTGASVIGTARANSIEFVGSGTYRLYLFDVRMNSGKVFSEVRTVTGSGTNSGAAFSASIVLIGGAAQLEQTADIPMVFPLGVSTVKSLNILSLTDNDTTYNVRKYVGEGTVTTNTVTVSVTGDQYFASFETSDYIVVRKDTGAVVTPTSVAPGLSVAQAVLTFSGQNGNVVQVVAIVRKNGPGFTPRTKTLTDVAQTITGPNTTGGSYDTLNQRDGFKLVSVLDLGAGSLDITDRYTFDNGQRDTHYDYARIQLKPGAIPPAGNITVNFKYFAHGSGDYFCVDSYAPNYSASFTYEDIPSFQSSKGILQLRDCIDFRSVLGGSAERIDPNSIVAFDVQYYRPRIDKIYVDKKGVFGVQKGISADNPVAPNDPKDSMVLYTLYVPAYTFDPKDVIPTMVDNRRYTMRDIGGIDSRLKKLEYYTALSLAENQVANSQIFDTSTNTPYYKNGFIVDSFTGSATGNFLSSEYRVAIDRGTGMARPMFYEDNIKLLYTAASSTGVRRTGSLLTLDYYETDYISQPYASEVKNVNPFNVFTWVGSIELTPSLDEWKETQQAPDVIVDNAGVYSALVNMLEQENVIGTVWNEWQTNWTGVTDTVTTESFTPTGGATTTTITTSSLTQQGQSRTGTTTSITSSLINTQTYGNMVVDVSFVPFIRSRLVYFKATGLKPNTRVYPFFDSVAIDAYVNQQSPADPTAWWNSVQYWNTGDQTNYREFTQHPSGSTPLITNASGTVYGSFIIPRNSALNFKTGSRIFRLTDSPTNNSIDAQTYGEASYIAQGLMNTTSNLVVSTRVPVISTTQVSDSRVISSTTQSSVSTTVQPIPPAPPPVESDTVVVPPAFEAPWDAELDLDLWERPFGVRWYDPLAQTFLIDTQGGVMLTSIDLYFRTKDDDLPVTVDIRAVENGFPTQKIVPFSSVTLPGSSVTTSLNASAATKFTFPSPVFLLQGVEYCFVVTTNSTKYTLWVSQIGGYDVTNPDFRITSQPYNGVMFESQNASTWTPDQTRDIKFKLRRAAFTPSGTVVFNEAQLASRLLTNDALFFENGSNEVYVYHPNHGFFEGSVVTLSGIESNGGSNPNFTTNGILVANLNGSHTIDRVEMDWYSFSTYRSGGSDVALGNANSTGRAGGADVFASENKAIDVLHPIVSEIVTPDTSAVWGIRTMSGKSLAGSQVPYSLESNYTTVKVNDNIQMTTPRVVLAESDRAVNSSSTAKTFFLRGSLSTTRNNVSPIIDLDRVSAVCVANRVDNPVAITSGSPTSGFNAVQDFVEETEPLGGSALAKYITKQITLNDPAYGLRIYMGVNRPSGSDVKVYIKFPDGTSTVFDDNPWHLVSPTKSIAITDDRSIYDDVAYEITEDTLMTLTGSAAEVAFSSFAVKVVFTATNSAAVPTIRAFRAIAIS